MHPASAVSVRCLGRGPWLGAQAGVWAFSAATLAAWGVSWAGSPPAALPVALIAGTVAGGLAWRRLPRTEGNLHWTGSAWRFGDEPLAGVELMIDLGAAVLLRLRPASGPLRHRWVLVTAAAAGPDYRPLCAALHGRTRR